VADLTQMQKVSVFFSCGKKYFRMVFEWQTNITYGYLLSKLLNQALFFPKKNPISQTK
jgi:hypothetical protein